MSYSKDRERFIATMTAEGLDLDRTRALLRYATMLQRLAEAQCNGDWPYNGDRDAPMRGTVGRDRHDARYTTCPKCEASGVAKIAMRKSSAVRCTPSGVRTTGDKLGNLAKVCPDCRTQELVCALLEQCDHDSKSMLPVPCTCGFTPKFQGDPRGYVFYVAVPSGKRDYSDALGIGVPARH